MKPLRIFACVLTGLATTLPPTLMAQESRTLNPIARPRPAAPAAVPAPRPAQRAAGGISREAVHAAAERLVKAWNTPELRDQLSDRFFDKTRLIDALATKVPRDARLTLLGVQGMQLLGEEIKPHANGLESDVISKVSVTLRTVLEFNDPATGFQRREGTNEAILVFREVR